MSLPIGEQATLGELAKAAPAEPAALAHPARRRTLFARGVPAWLQVTPFAAVFMIFFLIPLGLTVMVSFWDYNEYQIIPAFTTRSYTEIFEGCIDKLPELCVTFKTYLSTLKFCLAGVAHHARGRLLHRLFPRLPRPLGDDADRAVSRLHDPVLDLERDPHDLVDPAARPQRAHQPGAASGGHRARARRMADLFRRLGDPLPRPPLCAVHDRADLQLDDAHRPLAHRSFARCRRVRLADAVERGHPACRSRAS